MTFPVSPDLTLRGAALVATGAALGGLVRWATSAWLPGGFPWGTTVVNVVGCFLVGLALFGGIGGALGADARLFLVVGFLGALTTMSSFAYAVVAFAEDSAWSAAALAFLLNPVLSLAAAWTGRAVALGVAGP